MSPRISSSKVTSKGQITIPIKVRRRLAIGVGTRLSLMIRGDELHWSVLPQPRSGGAGE
jgi:AbrB family looped-hinge helix DNA binding protein